MIYSVNELRKETVSLIKRIDMQISEIEKLAKELKVDPHVLRHSDGTWPMAPLLAAKATAYNTLVMLQTVR
jgi:hypothetical protein